MEEQEVRQQKPVENTPPKQQVKLDSLIAAAGTASGSLMLYMFTQVQQIQTVVSHLESTQNVLVDEDGLIRPSVSAIRSEIQLDELYQRLARLEKYQINLVRND